MRVAVVGAGTAGATFAGTLAQTGRHEVVLIEAGTDFGPFEAHRWPFELLDSRRIPLTHDWDLENVDPSGRRFAVARARVMGGCSSHNGCAAVRGLRSDFDAWARLAGPFWNADDMLADFTAVERGLRVRTYDPAEITPFQQDVRDAGLALGIPLSEDINDIDEGPGVSMCPVNKHGGVRWNAAFGFVDPVRDIPGFSIVDGFVASGLIWNGAGVAGVSGLRRGVAMDVAADIVVVAAGAYASPELLMRSGIGDPEWLRDAGLTARHPLPGVGRNLQDHPCAVLEYRASEALIERMVAYERDRLAYDESIIVKERSPFATGVVDTHVFSCGGRLPEGGWYWQLWASLLTPLSRGQVRPIATDGGVRFVIEHNHFNDPLGQDIAAVRWALELARRIAGQSPLAECLIEQKPGPDEAALDQWIRANYLNYYHPAGTCAMGRDPAAGAVVDEMGRVHGVPGLMVVDAAIMPTITAGNTNIPAAAIAHRLARHFDQIQG